MLLLRVAVGVISVDWLLVAEIEAVDVASQFIWSIFSGPTLVALIELLVDVVGSADICVVSTLSMAGDGVTNVPLDVEPAVDVSIEV